MIFGLLRIKNEARWIKSVIEAILPICEDVFVFDDHSNDGTPEVCQRIDKVHVIDSPFAGLDETRDKNYLLARALAQVPDSCINAASPYWALAIDGDELLEQDSFRVLSDALRTQSNAFRLPVRYLWDSDMSQFESTRQVRVDGVYGRFTRPSVFRLMSRDLAYQSTSAGGNFHCSSVPLPLLHTAIETIPAPLWHLGYNERADRIRKYHWYNHIDPQNGFEDEYRHCVQGDIPEVPAEMKLRHAGPLRLVTMPGRIHVP